MIQILSIHYVRQLFVFFLFINYLFLKNQVTYSTRYTYTARNFVRNSEFAAVDSRIQNTILIKLTL